jgi:tyrosinase
MVERFVSDPIDLPDRESADEFGRADLVFYGVDHSGPSYEARIFINAPKADAGTPRDDPSYAGSFCIFGHGGCFGDVGHCDVPDPADRDPFDLRPPHQLVPAAKTVIVTEAFKRLVAPDDATMTVTVVAVVPGADKHDVLRFDTVRLLTYQ